MKMLVFSVGKENENASGKEDCIWHEGQGNTPTIGKKKERRFMG